MRREGKDFSRIVTPLFETMMVQANQEEGVDSGIPTDSWYGYQETDNNKDKTRQIRARDRKEREKTSPTVPSDFIGTARNPFNGPDQPILSKAQQIN
ncbi:hypothetical protein Tco_0959475 [Tanacetum coccineum]